MFIKKQFLLVYLTFTLFSCNSGPLVYENRFFNEKELAHLGIDGFTSPDSEGTTQILVDGTLFAFYATLDSHESYLAYVNYAFTFLSNKSEISFVGYYVDDVELSDEIYVKDSTNLEDYKQNGDNYLFFYTDEDTTSEKIEAYELLFSFSEEKVTLTEYFPDLFTYDFDFGIRTNQTIHIVE